MNRKPHFSLTRRAGGFVFISGQLALDENLELAGNDIVSQTRRCLENVRAAFATENVTLEDVVKVLVWLADPDDFWTFNETYAEFFPESPPVRTTVGSALMVLICSGVLFQKIQLA